MLGVLLRNNDKYTLNKEIKKVGDSYNKICIGIYPNNLEEFIKIANLCDGFILQGGSDYTDLEIEFVKYLYEKDIPTLGICLGMQMMSAIDGTLEKLNNFNHKSNNLYVHEVFINHDSKLYSILNKDKIFVNSRHIEHITNTFLSVSARSSDNVIEAVEDKNKRFFIGVQWHPESIMDDNSIKLFDSFFDNLTC